MKGKISRRNFIGVTSLGLSELLSGCYPAHMLSKEHIVIRGEVLENPFLDLESDEIKVKLRVLKNKELDPRYLSIHTFLIKRTGETPYIKRGDSLVIRINDDHLIREKDSKLYTINTGYYNPVIEGKLMGYKAGCNRE